MEWKKWRWKNLNLYQKFALIIICAGLIPTGIFSTVILNLIFKEEQNSIRANYEQAIYYIDSSFTQSMDSYNDISKIPYYYNYSSEGTFQYNYMSFDNLRKIVYGIGVEPEKRSQFRDNNMKIFLRNIQNMDSTINGSHFLAVDQYQRELSFHEKTGASFFESEKLFWQRVGVNKIDRSSKQLILVPTHRNDYVFGGKEWVFTIARNYFDLTQNIGTNIYVGTLYLDIELDKIAEPLVTSAFHPQDRVYIMDTEGNCYFSTSQEMIGLNLYEEEVPFEDTKDYFRIETKPNQYGLKVVAMMDTRKAFEKIQQTKTVMYGFLGGSVIMLLGASIVFSKRLTMPIRNMMKQMSEIETGNFNVELPVDSNDEIGILSSRFNQMSQELKTYINKSYIAQIKQNEAEMTALKSQIYPHFLYNTLEIIRMTALENGGEKVSSMIESLSQQIHYVIGPVKDMVPLKKEVDIVKKYIYLLNCRIEGKVHFLEQLNGLSGVEVPKLILQPIVENAYVHGIKPKDGDGSIMVGAEIHENVMEIFLMDNGVGMDEEALEKIRNLLNGDEIGIKNEHNWQSIGLKNVHDRIRFLYGEAYGIRITSTPKTGTLVRILLPAQDLEPYHGEDSMECIQEGKRNDQNDSS